MNTEKVKKAVLRFRTALNAMQTEVQAVIRELDEAEEVTMRPPSQSGMQAVKVEVVRFPEKGR